MYLPPRTCCGSGPELPRQRGAFADGTRRTKDIDDPAGPVAVIAPGVQYAAINQHIACPQLCLAGFSDKGDFAGDHNKEIERVGGMHECPAARFKIRKHKIRTFGREAETSASAVGCSAIVGG